jgi:hypothetical protein
MLQACRFGVVLGLSSAVRSRQPRSHRAAELLVLDKRLAMRALASVQVLLERFFVVLVG